MIFIFFLFSFCFSQNQGVIDGVLAIVDNSVVLRSDIEEQVFLLAKEKNISPQKSPLAFEKLYKKIIEEQIDRQVVLAFAKKDTLISVSNEEVNNTLDKRIETFVNIFGSKEALEDTMKMSINTIKGEYYKTVEEELFVEKFRFLNFNNTSISRQDVVTFFTTNPDSFPQQETSVDFSIIQHPVELSKETKETILSLAVSVKDSLDLGLLSFDLAVKRYSQDPGSVSSGGNLGYTKRGSLLPVYEQAAFSLKKGELSDPVESLFGFHIIQLLDRLGEKIKTKHILFSLKPGNKDKKNIIKKLNNKKESYFNDPSLFDSLAVSFYNEHKNLSGYYVNFDLSRVPSFLQKKLIEMDSFSFSEVFEKEGFLFLLYKYSTKKPPPLSLERDWVLIEQVALSHKNYKSFQAWIKEKKKEIYIKKFYN
tara:strand:+ start:24543 stop:25808 length:1266 start_codon:yes stop_codon:yes gene_type:complete